MAVQFKNEQVLFYFGKVAFDDQCCCLTSQFGCCRCKCNRDMTGSTLTVNFVVSGLVDAWCDDCDELSGEYILTKMTTQDCEDPCAFEGPSGTPSECIWFYGEPMCGPIICLGRPATFIIFRAQYPDYYHANTVFRIDVEIAVWDDDDDCRSTPHPGVCRAVYQTIVNDARCTGTMNLQRVNQSFGANPACTGSFPQTIAATFG